jgi:Zn-dependent oligopeptidase
MSINDYLFDIDTSNWLNYCDNMVDYSKKIIKTVTDSYTKLINIQVTSSDACIEILSIVSYNTNILSNFLNFCKFAQLVSFNNIENNICIAEENIIYFQNKIYSKQIVYDNICRAFDFGKNRKIFSNIDILFLNKIICTFEDYGVNFIDEKKKDLFDINTAIYKAQLFIVNKINQNISFLYLSKNDLFGLPSEILNKLHIVNDKYEISNDKKIIYICLRYVQNSDIRKKLEAFYYSRYEKNYENLLKLLLLRQKKAELLSHTNYLELKCFTNMEKSDDIQQTLIDINKNLDNRFTKEILTLQKFKKKYTDINELHSNIISSWDVQYYMNKWKTRYGLDDRVVSQFFPVKHVVENIIKIYQQLFKISFSKFDSAFKWNNDVIIYKVTNSDSSIIGYIFFDIYSKNSYKSKELLGHKPKAFSLKYSYFFNNKYVLPVSALIASLDENDVMTHREVTMLFRELGTCLHQILGKTRFSILSGDNVESTFKDTFPQILEKLCWNNKILKLLSKHVKTCEKIPSNIIDKMNRLKNVNVGYHFKKIIISSLFNIFVHSSRTFISVSDSLLINNPDTSVFKTILFDFYKQIYDKIIPTDYYVQLNDLVTLPLSLISIISDNNCYESIYSDMFSSDIYIEKFVNQNILKSGLEIKEKMFSVGGSICAKSIIKNIIGRKPTNHNFAKFYGFSVDLDDSIFLNTDQIKSHTKLHKQEFKPSDSDSNFDNNLYDSD